MTKLTHNTTSRFSSFTVRTLGATLLLVGLTSVGCMGPMEQDELFEDAVDTEQQDDGDAKQDGAENDNAGDQGGDDLDDNNGGGNQNGDEGLEDEGDLGNEDEQDNKDAGDEGDLGDEEDNAGNEDDDALLELPAPILLAPQFSAGTTTLGIQFTWPNENTGDDFFVVEYSDDGFQTIAGELFFDRVEADALDAPVEHTPDEWGRTWRYRVMAISGDIASDYSNEGTTTVFPPQDDEDGDDEGEGDEGDDGDDAVLELDAPILFAPQFSTGTTTLGVQFTWPMADTGDDYFVAEYSNDGFQTIAGTVIANRVEANSIDIAIEHNANEWGQTWRYRVKAVSGNVEGDYSNERTTTVFPAQNAGDEDEAIELDRPTLFAPQFSVGTTTLGVQFTWPMADTGDDYFVAEYSDDGFQTIAGTVIANRVEANSIDIAIEHAENEWGQTWRYRVKAVSGDIESQYSQEKNTTVFPDPNA